MSETPTTPFSNKVEILAELWMDYREHESFKELITYGDLAFPLSFAIAESVVESTPLAEQYIDEAWELFLGQLETEDTGHFESVSDVFDSAPYPKN